MTAHPAPIVTTDHIQRAYAQLRKADWPPLDEMQRMATQMAIVRSRACALANGRPLPAEPLAAAPAPRSPSPRALGHTERRRRDDQAIDLKSRAAGEKPEDT